MPDVVIVLACSFQRTSLLRSHIVWCTVHTQQSTFISSTIEQYQQAKQLHTYIHDRTMTTTTTMTTTKTTTLTCAREDSGSALTPKLAHKSVHPEAREENPTWPERPPRIGFAQLLPPLIIAWISNCNKTGVDILPTAIARITQALVLVGLLSMCSEGNPASWSGRTPKRLPVFSFLIETICVLLVIDLLRLDPDEAHELVSTAGWRDGSADLFGR